MLGGRSMTQLVVHEDSGITGPKDLRGKTITAMTYADSGYYALLGMLAGAGLGKNDVDAQAAGPAGTWQLFAARKADAMAAVPEWIAEVREKGSKVRIMSAFDYTKSMAQAILASDDVIKKRPDLVRKLVRATLRGLKDIMTDPKGAVRDYVAAMPTHKGREAFRRGDVQPLQHLRLSRPVGARHDGRRAPRRIAEVLRAAGHRAKGKPESRVGDL